MMICETMYLADIPVSRWSCFTSASDCLSSRTTPQKDGSGRCTVKTILFPFTSSSPRLEAPPSERRQVPSSADQPGHLSAGNRPLCLWLRSRSVGQDSPQHISVVWIVVPYSFSSLPSSSCVSLQGDITVNDGVLVKPTTQPAGTEQTGYRPQRGPFR